MTNSSYPFGVSLDGLANLGFSGDALISFLQSQTMNSHEKFLSWVNSEILYAMDDLESYRDTLTDTLEDIISDRLVSIIRARGKDLQIDVTREERQSGHCDIVIKKNSYIWRAEAKRYKGQSYINDGVIQYISRYEPGSYTLNHAGFFTYHQHGVIPENNQKIIDKIKEYHHIENITHNSQRPTCFDIVIKHPKTQNPVKIRFYSINCMHGISECTDQS